MSTMLCGIAASSHWDTAGESISIEGMDISSLIAGKAIVNFEHKSEKSSDYIGRVIMAKKIFSEKDCANENELKYWNKCGVPFIYCIVRLFDDYQPSAKEVAAIFNDDIASKLENSTLGFSIEGAKLSKDPSGIITNSIARKLTITAQPANHSCVVDRFDPNSKEKSSDPLAFLFKSQSVEIELFKSEEIEKMEKSEGSPKDKSPLKLGWRAKPKKQGDSGVNLHHYSHGSIKADTNKETGKFEVRHNGSLANMGGKKAIFDTAREAAEHTKKYTNALHNETVAPKKFVELPNDMKGMKKPVKKSEDLEKALTAGGYGMSSPDKLTGGAALQKEDLKGKKVCLPKEDFVAEHKELVDDLKHPTKAKIKEQIKDQSEELKNIKKSDWLARAEEEYKNWHKREEFEKFMKSRMPLMAKGEIESLGKIFILKKSVDMEKFLTDLIKDKK